MSKKLIVAVAAVFIAATAASTVAEAKPWGWGGGYHHHHGWGWRGPAAAGLFGAVALGALAASAGGCGYVSQPYYNSWGEVIGYRRVPAC